MSMIRIARVVKYKGVVYPANTDIVVDDRDVSDLLSRGGWIINKGPVVKPTVEDAEASTTNEEEVEESTNEEGDDVVETEETEETEEVEEVDPEAEAKELRMLRSKAKKLGIEVNPNEWLDREWMKVNVTKTMNDAIKIINGGSINETKNNSK